MDIDLVYLWIDGSDPIWQAKKKAFESGAPLASHEAVNDARFIDNDELKFSLRSVEVYAPWIRHIYIITDNQVPSWLDLSNPRISIIDHSEILPPSALPTFSSPAIEWCIDRIPGLSEHFLLANDDTFMARRTVPGDFFTPHGCPIVRLRKRRKSKQNAATMYMKTLFRAQELIHQRYGVSYKYIPHHNIDSYRLSDFKACKEIFQKEVDETVHRHVRHEDDLQRAVILYYALANAAGQLKLIGRYNKAMSLKDKVRSAIQGRFHYDSRCINIRETDMQRIIHRYNPMLFCLNDNEQATEADRLRAHEFLEHMYPEKSEFEI